MAWIPLDPSGYRRTPWKNGGGVTVDIADAYDPGHPPGGWSGLIWRLGRTRIERPAPFSDLAGCDRILTVIEGRGLSLVFPDRVLDVREPFRPARFRGEGPIESRLDEGPVGVLNLVADRSRAAIDVTVAIGSGELRPEGDVVVLYAPAGPARVVLPDGPRTIPDDGGLRCQGWDGPSLTLESGVLAVASVRLVGR